MWKRIKVDYRTCLRGILGKDPGFQDEKFPSLFPFHCQIIPGNGNETRGIPTSRWKYPEGPIHLSYSSRSPHAFVLTLSWISGVKSDISDIRISPTTGGWITQNFEFNESSLDFCLTFPILAQFVQNLILLLQNWT